MLRDGQHRTAVDTGLAPYKDNSIDGGAPTSAGVDDHGYVQNERLIEGRAVRANPVSFDEHLTLATMFYRSMASVEQDHIVEAFTQIGGATRIDKRSGPHPIAASSAFDNASRTFRLLSRLSTSRHELGSLQDA